MTKQPIRLTLVAAALALTMCAAARANFKSLSQRLPASSNAVIAVNVEKLLQTPFAKSEEWAQSSAAALANQPVMIPPGSTRLVMAAEVQPSTLESIWEMSVIEMKQVPPAKAIADAEGGYIDRVWDKDAVCSPINAYFVPLDGNTLASITPANRAAISKWVRTPTSPEGNVASEYLKPVLTGLGDQTDIVMAMDLEGAFSLPRIRRWLDESAIKEIKPTDMDAVTRTLGGLKGITFEMKVNQDVTGKLNVDFDKDASVLRESAKPILTGVLNAAGMRMDDLQSWNAVVVGKRVTMEGKVSAQSLRRLLSIVQSPIPAVTVAAPPAAAAPGDAAASPAAASQKYYKVICATLDGFSAQNSASDSAMWARSAAKRIEKLPILNVDPQLVQWGTLVSTKLKQAGATMGMAQTEINSRVAGVMDPGYSIGYYDNEGNYTSDVSRVDSENASRQRRQAALEQRAQAQQQAVQILGEIAETRPQIRAAMVEKYQVEF